MSFTIKFDNSKSNIESKYIYIQILSVNEGSWNFKNKQWDPSTTLPQAHFQTLDKIDAVGVTLADFTGGGRVYVSVGGATNSKYISNKDGSKGIQADIYNAKKWPHRYVFDKIEMGGDPDSIVNQTAVDFYSLPLYFQIDDGKAAGYINSRKAIMDEMDTSLKEKPWSELLIKDSTGKHTIGVLNPATASAQDFGKDSTILSETIKSALPFKSTLYVGTNKIHGKSVQTFEVDEVGTITSTDGDDHASIPAECFTSFSVFCNANVSDKSADPGKHNLFGAICTQILRGLSFTKNDPSYFKNYLQFPYTMDPFAKVLHDPKNSKDGKAYTMGYDDTGAEDFSSSLSRPQGKGFTITIQDCGDLKTILNLA